MKNLIIIGVGGFAREVYWHAQKSHGFNTEWTIKGFLDGDVKLADEEYKKLPKNIPLLGDVDGYEICPDDVFACAVGTPQARKKLIEKILNRGGEFINIISKNSFVMPSVKLGRGVIVCSYNSVGDSANIKDFVAINCNNSIGHDVSIGEFSCIMSNVNISGEVNIEQEVFIANSAVIIPKIKVEKNSYIGAGSVVLKKVRAGSKVFGNPAFKI